MTMTMTRMVRLLHSCCAWPAALLVTGLLCSLTVLLSVVPGTLAWQLRVSRLWARICLLVTGCRVRVEGLDKLHPDSRYVIMANHQTALDIPVLLAVLPVSLRLSIWAKQSLFDRPFLGWAMRSMGFVSVDRQQRSTAAGMISHSAELIRQEHRSILVFPEETYGLEDRLLPFQRGGFILAFKTGQPILPVGIMGATAVLKPESLLVRPATVVVSVGDPISATTISQRQSVTDQTREAIALLSGKKL